MKITHAKLPHYRQAETFYKRARQLIETKAKEGTSLALVALDFDNFNFINDLFSYEIGNAVLQRLGEHFSRQLTEGELFTRLHADRFAFLVRVQQAGEVANRFYAMLNTKNVLADILPTHYNLVGSGGIVYVDEYKESLSALMDKANFARKQAKGNHANSFLRYDAAMSGELQWRKIITLTIETALREREFQMYLQPKVLLQTGEIIGAEALARWNNKEYGMIYPDRFIPILEQNGWVRQLDFFMLEEACRFLTASAENDIAPMPISVNFSKLHIRTADFAESVFETVSRYGLPTEFIEIEFTENIYLSEFQPLLQVTGALKKLGFKVALDDFGSAYSSLNYLKELPLNVIKIDKGFLEMTENQEKGRIIIAKTVDLIQSLQMKALMEGVETKEEEAFLQNLHCDFGQGYFYAKPMPKDAYIAFVKSRTPGAGR